MEKAKTIEEEAWGFSQLEEARDGSDQEEVDYDVAGGLKTRDDP